MRTGVFGGQSYSKV